MKPLVTACILLVTTTAFAESLEEKKFWKRQRDYIDEHLKKADKACGTNFSFDWVDQPTLRSEVAKTKHSPSGVCGIIIDTVASVCREGEDEKATVRAKITGFTCGYAKDRSLDLKGGIVKYSGNNTQSNFSEWAKPWLLKHL
jgi:hypothetical protein